MAHDIVENEQGITSELPFIPTFSPSKLGYLPWIICGLAILFYCYEFYLRIAPSVMTFELMRGYHVDATLLGNLTAFYYYAYTPMQLPVGMLMDHYGPRRLLTYASLACGLGSFLFAATHNLAIAEAGRFLVGFGSAFAFVGVLKLASIWLPANRFAMIAGLASGLGMVGAVFGDIELSKLVSLVGWRQTIYMSAVVGILLAFVMYFFIRDENPHSAQAKGCNHLAFSELFSAVGTLLKNPQIWMIGFIGCFMYLPSTAFAELWGVHYLRSVYHFSDQYASIVNSLVFLGFAIGSPIAGIISDRTCNRRMPLLVGSIFAGISIAIIISVPHLSPIMLCILLFLFGFASGAQAIVFAIAHELYPNRLSGTVLALINMFVMLGGMIFQPIIGKLLDLQWTGAFEHGIQIYTNEHYRYALIVLPIAMLLSVVLILLVKETGARVNNTN